MERVAVALGQMQQPDEPGLALDERADRGLLVLADDQVALPVPGLGCGPRAGTGRWWIDSIGCSNRGRRRSVRCWARR